MTSSATTATGTKPTLHTGDRMSPEEFDRIYADLHDVRAELIDGVVYVASPVRTDSHGRHHALLATVLGTFLASDPSADISDNGTLVMAEGSRVQPDLTLFRIGGRAMVNRFGYLEGAPEFIAEIAASTVDYDLRDKFELYQRAGIAEYLVWRTADRAIDFFRNTNGTYSRVDPGPDGIIESTTFPGLRFHITALLAGDLKTALSAVGNS